MSRDLCYRGNVLNLLNYIELSFGRSKMCYILIPSSNRVIPHCKSILSSDSLGRDGGSVHSGYFPNTLVANTAFDESTWGVTSVAVVIHRKSKVRALVLDIMIGVESQATEQVKPLGKWVSHFGTNGPGISPVSQLLKSSVEWITYGSHSGFDKS